MKRLKGPEIKMPDLKVPKPLADLYYDLDERHLIPVVAILVVAIIAIPLLLSGASDSASETPAEAGASASVAPSSKPSSMVIAKATPRLRDYRRRLDHLQPKDPFKPHYTGSDTEETGASTSSASTTEATEVTATTTESTTAETGGGASPDSTPNPGEADVTFFTYAIDVRVVPVSAGDGKPSQAEPTVRHDLPPLVMLPSRDTPALTYVGPSRDEKKAIMLVSDDVTALFGDSNCVLGSQSCQLLALEPGAPETVVFGPRGRTFRIELLKIQILTSDQLNRAALGKPKQPKQSQQPGK